jgi:hypothetical protein
MTMNQLVLETSNSATLRIDYTHVLAASSDFPSHDLQLTIDKVHTEYITDTEGNFIRFLF